MAGPQVNFEVRGINRVRNQLRTIAAFHPELSDPVIEKHVKAESNRLRNKSYPSYLPHFRHKRTGALGRSFRAQKVKAGHWRIINRRNYAAWVVSEAFQLSHPSFRRWWTIEKTLQDNMPELTQALSRELERQLERQPD